MKLERVGPQQRTHPFGPFDQEGAVGPRFFQTEFLYLAHVFDPVEIDMP